MKSNRASEQGYILIYILFISVAVIGLSFLTSKTSRNSLKETKSIEQAFRLNLRIQSIRKIIESQLRIKPVKLPYSASIDNIGVKISGSNSFLNINEAKEKNLEYLAEAVDLSPAKTRIIRDSILDWVDQDSDPRAFGAEDSYYQQLSPSYECKNSPVSDMAALGLIRGMDTEAIKKISPFISFESEGLHINSAPPEVLFAHIGDWQHVETIVKAREEETLDSQKLSRILPENIYLMLMSEIALAPSKEFRIEIRGREGRARNTFTNWQQTVK